MTESPYLLMRVPFPIVEDGQLVLAGHYSIVRLVEMTDEGHAVVDVIEPAPGATERGRLTVDPTRLLTRSSAVEMMRSRYEKR